MPKECRMTKHETRTIRHSDFVILSSFVIRHSSFVLGGRRSIRMRVFTAARRVLAVFCACGVMAAPGCGGPKHVPVAGTATTVDGKPLAGLVISFNADPAKGNDARVACMGRIS